MSNNTPDIDEISKMDMPTPEIEKEIRSVLTPNSYIVPAEGIKLTKHLENYVAIKQLEARIDEYYFTEWYPDQAKWIGMQADRIKELQSRLNKLKGGE